MRTMVAVLVVLGCLGVGQARADYPPTRTYYIISYNQQYLTPEPPCAAYAAQQKWASYSVTGNAASPVCQGPTTPQYAYIQRVDNSCATGDTLVNGVCKSATQANCADATTMSKYVGAWVVGGGSTAPNYACIQGCQYPQGSTAVGLQTSYGMSVGKGNGQVCSGANYDSIDTTTKPTDPPSPVSCAQKGKVYGTVNGVGDCYKGGDVPGTSIKQNDTKTSTTTDASGVQAPTQTTNTTTTITNVNGVSTVTQTTTKPDGSKETTTDTKDSYCSKNPNDKLCKDISSATGGDDCAAAPACNGDAVQCAMLKQQWLGRCQYEKTTPQSDLGSQVLAGNDPASSSNPAAQGNRDVRSLDSAIDDSAFLGGAGGLQDKVYTVNGRGITFPFSRLNPYLVMIGNVFVAISLIGAARIVVGVK